MDQYQFLKLLNREQLIEIIEIQSKEYEELKNGVIQFVEKNFIGGAKSDREDYVQPVTAKDIWELRKLISKE